MNLRASMTVIVLAASLGACTTPLTHAAVSGHQPIGLKIKDAIASNGPPTSQWDMPDGRRAFQWQQYSVTARIGVSGPNGAVAGAAHTGQTTCYYTLYTRKDDKGLWTVVGYDEPSAACGKGPFSPSGM